MTQCKCKLIERKAPGVIYREPSPSRRRRKQRSPAFLSMSALIRAGQGRAGQPKDYKKIIDSTSNRIMMILTKHKIPKIFVATSVENP
jgi:hypothetical protein